VIDDPVKAIQAVAHFFKTILKNIEDAVQHVIKYLRPLFGWGEILKTHELLKRYLKSLVN